MIQKTSIIQIPSASDFSSMDTKYPMPLILLIRYGTRRRMTTGKAMERREMTTRIGVVAAKNQDAKC